MNIQGVEFNEDEFSVLQFGYRDVLKQPVISHYKEFRGFIGFKDESVVSYLSLMYDPKTPLMKIQDLGLRKKVAAEIAGLKGEVQLIFNLKSEPFNQALTRWFEIVHNSRFELYITLCEAFAQLLSAIREPVTSEDEDARMKTFKLKGDLQKLAVDRERELSELTAELFKSAPEVVEKVTRVAKKARRAGYAEEFALNHAGTGR